MNKEKIILLVEDNADDAMLTQRALKQGNIVNKEWSSRKTAWRHWTICRAQGPMLTRMPRSCPQWCCWTSSCRKWMGLEVLRRLRANERTRLLPVVILTSSKEEEDVIASYKLGANSYTRKPVDFAHFSEAVKQLGLYWMLVNIPPPAKTYEGEE